MLELLAEDGWSKSRRIWGNRWKNLKISVPRNRVGVGEMVRDAISLATSGVSLISNGAPLCSQNPEELTPWSVFIVLVTMNEDTTCPGQ